MKLMIINEIDASHVKLALLADEGTVASVRKFKYQYCLIKFP